jgi:hypothetical protein
VRALLTSIPDIYNGKLPAPPASQEAADATNVAFERLLRLNMQVKKTKHGFDWRLELSPPSSTTTHYTIFFKNSSSSSVSAFGAFKLSLKPYGCCEVAMTARMNKLAGARSSSSVGAAESGAIPSSASSLLSGGVSSKDAKLIVDDLLSLVPSLFNLYSRCDEIDDAVEADLVERFASPSTPPPTPAEDAIVDKARAYPGAQRWVRIKGTVREPASYYQALSKADTWGLGVADVDASAERVLAYVREQSSYHRSERKVGVSVSASSLNSLAQEVCCCFSFSSRSDCRRAVSVAVADPSPPHLTLFSLARAGTCGTP